MYKQRSYNKYGAKTQEYNGRHYHSKLEAAHAQELDLLLKAGEIKEWIPQYKVDLRAYGKHITNYYVDFKVINADDSVEYHEVKGYETDTWQLKWKLFEAQMNEEEPGAELIVLKQSSIGYYNYMNKKKGAK
jgi:hypothetical protein